MSHVHRSRSGPGKHSRHHAQRALHVDRLEPRLLMAATLASLSLYNADTDQPIAQYTPFTGGTIDLASARNLNIVASASGAGSVKFSYDTISPYRIDNTAPYAFAGNSGGDYYAWTPTVGTHTVKATPWSGANASGTSGTPIYVTFNVI